MSLLRTANLMAALACEIANRLDRDGKAHANETTSAIAALNLISFYEGCSNGALAEALGLSHTATVRLVDKLEAAGFVVSSTGSDKRSVALYLTDAGQERAREAVRRRCALVSDALAVLTAEQRAQLDAILEALLPSMVVAAKQADRVCRLCDITVCSLDTCPVHQRAVALSAA